MIYDCSNFFEKNPSSLGLVLYCDCISPDFQDLWLPFSSGSHKKRFVVIHPESNPTVTFFFKSLETRQIFDRLYDAVRLES